MPDCSVDRCADAQPRLETDGYCVVEQGLERAEPQELHEALFRLARFDRESGWQQRYAYDGAANANHRVWNLISRDPLFCRLVEHPLALVFLHRNLGWPAMLSSSAANIVHVHGAEEVLHADQMYMPEPWSRAHGINVAWCLDDFTAENGATLVAPGSHRLGRSHREDEALPPMIPVTAPAGSMIVFDGRCWHGTGQNRTTTPRAGIFNWYTLPIYLPKENWYLSLNPAISQFGSDTMLTLLGFNPGLLGRVNGLAPGRV